MYTGIRQDRNEIIIHGIRDFELSHILDCGQCFRWNPSPIMEGASKNSYVGVVDGRAARLTKHEDTLHITGTSIGEAGFWIHYFDLERDYGSLKRSFLDDPILAEAIQYGHGMRILNQPQFEIIISFIISANKKFSMIKSTVESISKRFGTPMEFEGQTVYSFPTPLQLSHATVEDLRQCACGYRAEYIVETTKSIIEGRFCIDETMAKPLPEAHKDLMSLSGVGPKVADCILLFSMEKNRAFPVDVWVKRVMQHFYTAPDLSLKRIREYGMDKFGPYAGMAQQYLFFYARENKIGTNA